MNMCSFVGNISNDFEIKCTKDGKSVIGNLQLAVKNPTAEKNDAFFLRCEIWGKNAEFLNTYCCKGCKIGVTGSLWQKKYNDKAYFVLLVNTVESLASLSDKTSSQGQREEKYSGNDKLPDVPKFNIPDESDLPF